MKTVLTIVALIWASGVWFLLYGIWEELRVFRSAYLIREREKIEAEEEVDAQ